MPHQLSLHILPGRYAVARLAPDATFPDWLDGSGFQAAIRAEDELTIVCSQERVPLGVEAERDWSCLRTIGPFDFETTGIVQSLVSPLSDHGIGVFVLCTFDGEHILVPGSKADAAMCILKQAGHDVDRVEDRERPVKAADPRVENERA